MIWLSYPFLRYVMALSAGICLGRMLPAVALTPLAITWLLAGLAYCALHRYGWLGLCFLVVSGSLTVLVHDPTRAPDWIGRETVRGYEAVILSTPEKRATFDKVLVRVKRRRTKAGWQSGSGLVLCYLEKSPVLHYGDVLLLNGSPDTIPPPRNPGEFDFKGYQALSGIFHQQYLRAGQYACLGNAPPLRLTALAAKASTFGAQVLQKAFSSSEDAAVAVAMLIGGRAEIDQELLQAYSSAGAIHALSVSGMHVGVLFLVISRLLGFLKNRGTGGRWTFAGLALAFVWGYALLTGLSTPVVRSALMLSLFVAADTFRLDSNPLNTLAFSAFATLLFQPLALFQMSFQLSYLSVAGLMVLYPLLRWLWRPENPLLLELWEMSCAAVAAQAATFPLAVYYFHQFPTYFLLANPFVLSLSAGGLVFGLAYLAFAWMPLPESFLRYSLQLFFGGMNGLIRLTDRLPGARWTGLSLSAADCLLTSAVILLLFLLLFRRKRMPLWPALAAAVVLCGRKGLSSQRHRHQRVLIVHHVRKQGVISAVCGRTHYLWTEPAPDATALSRSVFCLRPVFGVLRTDSLPVRKGVPGGKAAVIAGRVVIWLSAYSRQRISFRAPVDYLIFSHNARRYPDAALLASPVGCYIFDGTNSAATVDRWQKALHPLGKRCVDIRREGAFVSEW